MNFMYDNLSKDNIIGQFYIDSLILGVWYFETIFHLLNNGACARVVPISTEGKKRLILNEKLMNENKNEKLELNAWAINKQLDKVWVDCFLIKFIFLQFFTLDSSYTRNKFNK